MKFIEKGHTITVKFTEATLDEFIKKVLEQYNATLCNHNLIIDLTKANETISNSDFELFEYIAIRHIEEQNKSFVLVASSIDFNEYDEDLIIVPSVQEAHDLIEMDEIQRDLGF